VEIKPYFSIVYVCARRGKGEISLP